MTGTPSLTARRRGSSATRRRPVRALKSALLVLVGLLLGFPALLGAAGSAEYQVKAAFLYNFMKFVEWPGDSLNAAGTITLGILGKDPFGEAIEEVRGKTAKGRRIAVAHLRTPEEARECDLLFVCASEKGRFTQILKAVQNYRVLTVADQEGFCQAGGMINLVSVKNRVGFEVNVAAATRARLRISSQLLKLARQVVE